MSHIRGRTARARDGLPSRSVPGSVQSIERAAAILQVVAGSRGTLGVTDIAEAVGLAKTTTHSLLRTLLLVGFVTQDNRIRLRINVEAIKAAGLTISSKLLRIAEIVGDERSMR